MTTTLIRDINAQLAAKGANLLNSAQLDVLTTAELTAEALDLIDALDVQVTLKGGTYTNIVYSVEYSARDDAEKLALCFNAGAITQLMNDRCATRCSVIIKCVCLMVRMLEFARQWKTVWLAIGLTARTLIFNY